jgi:hypothetical protein
VADLFAAGPQSYQNPLGYRAGLSDGGRSRLQPAWTVGLALTVLQVAAGTAWALHRLALPWWSATTPMTSAGAGWRWRGAWPHRST